MKPFYLLLSSIIFYTSASCQNSLYKDVLVNKILRQVSQNLNSLKSVRYDLKRELNYSSENYHNETTWNSYYDFQSADTIIGFKYQIEDEMAMQIYNGTEKFELDKKVKTIKINDQPNQRSFSSSSVFYNSIITLKNVLPLIIADKTIAKAIDDTLINKKPYYLITLHLTKRRMQNLGNGFDAMTTKSNLIYKIIIDKTNDLPFEVLQINNKNEDFIKTSFTNLNINSPTPPEFSWYYSTYIYEYKPAVQKDLPQLISVGSLAPEWTLPLYDKKENIALRNFKGKVVLLDFWIKNCGPCIKSIPDLNALQQKFKNEKFEILGINSYDPREDIIWFCNKHKPKYKNLMQGKEIAVKYGVTGFPTVILIDKNGKVLYSGNSLEKIKNEKMIEKAL